MIGPMYKTGEEIYDTLQLVKHWLGLEHRPAGSSLKAGETYRDKTYAFSWFMSKKAEFVYIIKELKDIDKKKEAKEMTKEEALKKIEELREYVEKCEEKEKEIPRMDRRTLPKAQPAIIWPCKKDEEISLWWKDVTAYMTFNEDNTVLTWAILAYELAQLMYCREYLKVNSEDLIKARRYGEVVFRVVFVIKDCDYAVSPVKSCEAVYENDRIWCFTDNREAQRVCDYMNKYVKDIKKEMH